MRVNSFVRTAGAGIAGLCVTMLATGCDFNPGNYMSRNACEFFNCDELFFIEDMLPLSARPTGDAGSGGGMVMDIGEDEDEGGGHAH